MSFVDNENKKNDNGDKVYFDNVHKHILNYLSFAQNCQQCLES